MTTGLFTTVPGQILVPPEWGSNLRLRQKIHFPWDMSFRGAKRCGNPYAKCSAFLWKVVAVWRIWKPCRDSLKIKSQDVKITSCDFASKGV